MQAYTRTELSVGAFMIAGALALAYLSLTLGGLELSPHNYRLTARFSSVGDLKAGDPVKIAGVSVGEVAKIDLVDFAAEAELSLKVELKLPLDTIASIQSSGLLGDSYVSLSPGAADRDLEPNARIARTEPAISLNQLIAKYAFGSPVGEGGGKPSSSTTTKDPVVSDPLE